MQYLLVVFFFVNGETIMVKPFLPQPQPTAEVCEQRAERVETYLLSQENVPTYNILCYRTLGKAL